ncbi:helix-turn-helix domain-containing protein [Halopseudomonas phragmitis]|uniref:HTH cro/C1-type domain-containing protein n=1 Tax=Halopseudomonas phragmitis TaxID=1931241 RepID=A0A1V0B6H0_9GAMM|nr:hypothetical protein [Halopseudomonas phragmitis]AQZ95542.1 hypothetical protein BVH74_12630 [Halopseudomonas phragmitis]
MDIGERLRSERERLGYSQTKFAELASASKHAQINWEKGVAAPNALALNAWAKEGVDILFVVTGVKQAPAPTQGLPADEQLLLESYRALPAIKKKTLLADLLTGVAAKKSSRSPKADGVSVTGNNNRTAGRDYNEKES